MRRRDEVDINSLSYIRGRYGPDSKEYKKAKLKNKVEPVKLTNEIDILQPMPGESPLDFVRRKARQSAASN